jgi:hypothetical protein
MQIDDVPLAIHREESVGYPVKDGGDVWNPHRQHCVAQGDQQLRETSSSEIG